MAPDVTVVVVTFNALPWIERCLDSVQGHDVVVVDNGSTDGTVALVRERYPNVRVIEQENRGMGGGNNTGMRASGARWWFLLNSDAWVLGDGLAELVRFGDAHPRTAVVGPRLRNEDGSLQRSVRGEPTLWGLATEYLFLRKLAPRTQVMNPLYAGGFDHESDRKADWLSAAALLVRREAAEQVGLFDESFFMFSEEVDWLTRFRRAGWEVWFHPAAEVVHVGGASHGGRLYNENLRGHLRWFAKHRGPQAAERARLILLWGVRLRRNREAARFLESGSAADLTR